MLRVTKTIDDIIDLRNWFESQGSISLDTETTGIDTFARDFEIRLIQFGNKSEAWVVPFEQWRGAVIDLIDRFTGHLLIHNASFDVQALATRGVKVPWHRVEDTMIAMRLAEPHRLSGLKEAATRYVSSVAGQSQTDLHKAMRANDWTWATIPIDYPAFIHYAAMDVILTARLRDTPVCQSGFDAPLYPLEMDVREICSRMERNGMRVDVEHCHEKRADLLSEIDMIKRMVQDDHGFSLTSNGDLGKFLLSQGVPLTKTTGGGAPSVARDALEEVLPRSSGVGRDMIEKALRVRKIQKLASSYYENFINLSTDGVLHPSIETIAARTGRMSIRNPALQTLPRVGSDPDSDAVRRAVIPRADDEVLIACDYSQIELRCIANFSHDEKLQQAFLDTDAAGSDFFTAAMRTVYNDDTLDKSDPRRTGIKTLFYASGYGAGVAKMAATAGLPIDEMKEISAQVFSVYPGIKKLMRACETAAKEGGDWITTPMGRRIWIDPDFGYKAMNGLIQGHAADVFKRSLVNMAHAGLEDLLVVPVHDEALLSVPWDDVEEVSHIVGTCMTDRTTTVPLLAEPGKPAMTWAEAK